MTYSESLSNLDIFTTSKETMEELYTDIKKILIPNINFINVTAQSDFNGDRWSHILFVHNKNGIVLKKIAIEKIAKRLDNKRPLI
tara:strand:- start:215 stop:469 length:255 start_codon:yes stop_codon:yes gene_type:complete